MPDTTTFDPREAGATVVGSVAGVALVGGGLRVGVGAGGFDRVGTLAGVQGPLLAWTAVLVASVAVTVAFGRFLGYATNPFVSRLFALTRRSDRLRAVLLPVVTNHAYVATALSLGLAYGLSLGVLVGAVGVPVLSVVLGVGSSPALLAGVGVVAWTAYGVAVGGVYAVLTDRS